MSVYIHLAIRIVELCIDSENQIDVNSDYLRVVVDANILITK